MRVRRLLAVLAALSLLVSVFAMGATPEARAGASPWRWQNPLPNGESLNAVSGRTTGAVWAVGNRGMMLKSLDDGDTWAVKPSATTVDLADIDVFDDNNGWAVGASGTIIKIAGGECTPVSASPTTEHLRGVDAIDATHAYAVGENGVVIKTDDGNTWSLATNQPSTSQHLNTVYFTSASAGFVAGEGNAIFYTADGGATAWTARPTTSAGFAVEDITATTSGLIFAGGLGLDTPAAFFTSDNGANYTVQDVNSFVDGRITGVAVNNMGDWFGTSAQGQTLMYDGGAWQAKTMYYSGTPSFGVRQLTDIARVSDGCVYVGDGGAWGLLDAHVSTFYNTPRAVASTSPVMGMDFLSATTGYAISGPNVIKTTDGGESWSSQTTGETQPLYDVDFVDATHGWAVGDHCVLFGNGSTWVETCWLGNVRSVCAVSASDVWVCGDTNGYLAHFNGTNWQDVNTSQTRALNCVDFFDAQHGIAVGADGTVLYTINGGLNWTAGASGEAVGDTLYSVKMVSDTVAYLVGDDNDGTNAGMIMRKTTDGGATWNPMAPPVGNSDRDLRAVAFTDASNGWIVGGGGSGGALYRTTNGGDTWVNESVTDEMLYSVSAVDASTAWAGTNFGGFLTTKAAPTPPPPINWVTVYRFFNTQTGTHFYTASADEANMVMARWSNVFSFDGPAYTYNGDRANRPLFRLFNKKNGGHFYTTSEGEARYACAAWPTIFSWDGPTYSVCDVGTPNSIPVYRFYNRVNGSHFYTASPTERDMVMQRWPNVFALEGPAFALPQ